MTQLTKRQHFVPAFYLRLWHKKHNGSALVCYDIQEMRSFQSSPDKILVKQNFYEEDSKNPNNTVEKILGQMESKCSVVFNQLGSIEIDTSNSLKEKKCLQQVESALINNSASLLKEFAAYQYLRIPGAINQKKYEMQTNCMPEPMKEKALIAGSFVQSGFTHIKQRFQTLKMLILISKGEDFITSDWPCFDLKYDFYSPLLGEEVGNSSEVVVYMPITPRIAAILFHPDFCENIPSNQISDVVVKYCRNAEVRNQNTLVIQQAERFVVACKGSPFIFQVAMKRKKSRT